MQQRYRMIVFDWDGTLMDSAAAIVNSIQKACQDLDVRPPDDQQARYVIGLGLSDAMRHAVPDLPENLYSKMIDRYRYHYLSQDHGLVLFAGVESILRDLSETGYLLAVATGKSRIGLSRALEVSGLASTFQSTRCADECFSKPHPQMLNELLEEFALEPRDALMIGDTTHDLQMAANAAVDAVGVSYGAHPKAALQEMSPKIVVDDVQSLANWLRTEG